MSVSVEAQRKRKPARPRAAAPTTPDAIEIAMEAEAGDLSPDSPARRVLVEQLDLIRTQTKLGRRQIVSENLGLALKVGIGLLVLVIVAVLGVMVWNASRADGLVIRPFSVPPALAERGITGEAVAAQVMDRIGEMAQVARSGEAQRQIATSRDEVSIQIPETGISISQLEQWLKQKLGRERRVTGEVMTAPDGTLVLAARVGSSALTVQRAPQTDLAGLVQRAAEDLYGREQPASYTSYLRRAGRTADLRAFAEAASKSADRRVRARALLVLVGTDLTTDMMEAKRLGELAYALDRQSLSLDAMATVEGNLGHSERTQAILRQELAQLKDPKGFPDLSPVTRQQYINFDIRAAARGHGDYAQALTIDRQMTQEALLGFGMAYSADLDVINELVSLHDLNQAREALGRFQAENSQMQSNGRGAASRFNVAAENWPQAWADWQESTRFWEGRADEGAYYYSNKAVGARILINLGRLDEARGMIATMPLDCAPCVGVRGELAAAEGVPAVADHWFREAARMMPSMPMPSWRWGDALLKRGDPAGAIVQFQEASRRGPKWADPLEGWGEALLAQGDAAGAAKKFAAAAPFATNWGRLHLYWGEALARAGKNAEAMAQYRTASGLFLTPTEKTELARVQGAR